MIHTTVTPINTDLHLLIPKDYVGKQIEILVYPTDEVIEINENWNDKEFMNEIDLRSVDLKKGKDKGHLEKK